MGDLFPAEVGTDRLRLERLRREAVDPLALYEHVREGAPGIEAVTRYVPWNPYGTPAEAHESLERCERKWAEGEAATYVIRPREPEDGAGEFAGLAGLTPEWDRRVAHFGAWLRREFWGRGYSGERAGALMAVAFDRLDLEAVEVYCHADNENSRRAIEKYVAAHGGEYVGPVRNYRRYPDGEVPDGHLFSVTREQYAGANGRQSVPR